MTEDSKRVFNDARQNDLSDAQTSPCIGGITQTRLRALFRYESETGDFYRLVDRSPNARTGQRAGTRRADGYRIIHIDGKNYLVHRLAWLDTYGYLPSRRIDHANRDPSDNRIVNLRLATPPQNGVNSKTPRDNNSGFKGVRFRPQRSSWEGNIVFNGKQIYLGLYDSAEEARAAYCEAGRRLYGEFFHSGSSSTAPASPLTTSQKQRLDKILERVLNSDCVALRANVKQGDY